jgi:hypothetical protein
LPARYIARTLIRVESRDSAVRRRFCFGVIVDFVTNRLPRPDGPCRPSCRERQRPPRNIPTLFSRNPFVQQFGDQFATIRPNATREVSLPVGQSRLAIPLPDDLAGQNVLVEVTAAGKSRALPYYAAAMDVRVTETYGQLRAADVTEGRRSTSANGRR